MFVEKELKGKRFEKIAKCNLGRFLASNRQHNFDMKKATAVRVEKSICGLENHVLSIAPTVSAMGRRGGNGRNMWSLSTSSGKYSKAY